MKFTIPLYQVSYDLTHDKLVVKLPHGGEAYFDPTPEGMERVTRIFREAAIAEASGMMNHLDSLEPHEVESIEAFVKRGGKIKNVSTEKAKNSKVNSSAVHISLEDLGL